MRRKIDDKTYLGYLLLSLNVDDLKQICRDFDIKGFSGLTKEKLIEFILDSLSEEEIREFLNQNELKILSEEIELALKKINGQDKESIKAIKVVNPKKHEVEIQFKGWSWETSTFLSITPENIDNPDRDCDCKIGSNLGFCAHFFTAFIFSLKQNYFNLSEWTLTKLPDDFETKIKPIIISVSGMIEKNKKDIEEGMEGIAEEKEGAKTISLIDESSDNAVFIPHLNNRIMVYEGEITEILERQSEFQEHITKYYLVSMKNVKFGPQLKKASDYREEDVKNVEKLRMRLSDKSFAELEIKIGDRISCTGGLERDNYWGFMLKRVTKINKINGSKKKSSEKKASKKKSSKAKHLEEENS